MKYLRVLNYQQCHTQNTCASPSEIFWCGDKLSDTQPSCFVFTLIKHVLSPSCRNSVTAAVHCTWPWISRISRWSSCCWRKEQTPTSWPPEATPPTTSPTGATTTASGKNCTCWPNPTWGSCLTANQTTARKRRTRSLTRRCVYWKCRASAQTLKVALQPVCNHLSVLRVCLGGLWRHPVEWTLAGNDRERKLQRLRWWLLGTREMARHVYCFLQ